MWECGEAEETAMVLRAAGGLARDGSIALRAQASACRASSSLALGATVVSSRRIASSTAITVLV